jgi:hypothetical protein
MEIKTEWSECSMGSSESSLEAPFLHWAKSIAPQLVLILFLVLVLSEEFERENEEEYEDE